MTEELLLDNTLEVLDRDGIKESYMYLKSNIQTLENISPQGYNFLYCLAGLDGEVEEALCWLEEAIKVKGMWYRPEVFEDEDLDAIREYDRFNECKNISYERYQGAVKGSETKCTWKAIRAKKLILALHGNQQNINHAITFWGDLNTEDYQVEYIQSSELDSYGIYRWEDDGTGPKQLRSALANIDLDHYEEVIAIGFSAGCNVILRSLIEEDIRFDRVALQSPWIPMIKENMDDIVRRLKVDDTKVLVTCGELDEDCFDLSKGLYEACSMAGIDITSKWLPNGAHRLERDNNKIVIEFLNS